MRSSKTTLDASRLSSSKWILRRLASSTKGRMFVLRLAHPLKMQQRKISFLFIGLIGPFFDLLLRQFFFRGFQARVWVWISWRVKSLRVDRAIANAHIGTAAVQAPAYLGMVVHEVAAVGTEFHMASALAMAWSIASSNPTGWHHSESSIMSFSLLRQALS